MEVGNGCGVVGAPAKLVLTFDRTTLKADGQDLAYVEVQVVDKDGIPVPNAELTVKFSVKCRDY